MQPGGARSLAVVFLLAMAVMILEVSLTRVLSFITYHHMTYLVIGGAMLGFGAAGTYLTVRPGSSAPAQMAARIARHSALFGATTIIALYLVPKVHFYSMDMDHLGDSRNVLALVPLVALTVVPFFFAGVAIARIIGSAGVDVHRIYFADLVGSAAGSLAAIVLVNTLGGIAACVVGAAIPFLAAAVVTPGRRAVYAAAGVVLAVVSPLSERRGVLPLTVPPGKQLFGGERNIETVQWHVLTRLDVGAPMDCKCSFGGSLSQTYAGPPARARLIFQDGSNLTGILHPTPTPKETPIFGYYIQGAAFAVHPDASALVIGSGGGVDVMVALHHGARHVVAVDVNPKTMNLVRVTHADFAGHVFDGPSVEPVVSEGRHFLSHDSRAFDVIQLSGVDTWAAQASGAYALTENFIYTAEAFDAYLAHLAPDGIVGFSRPYVEPPLETLRLSATALEALERLGEEDPFRHVFIVAGLGQAADAPWAELLVKRSPFTDDEAETLRDFARRLDFEVVFDPTAPQETPLDGFLRWPISQRRSIYETYPLDIRPVTDDAPFYFQFHRWRDLFEAPLGLPAPMAMWILAGSLVEVSVLSLLLILYPLFRRGEGGKAHGGRGPIFVYFASLGLGFILVEIALLQKLTIFLGGPAYAMAISLSTLLFASGLGSMLSERRAGDPLALIGRVTPLLASAILVVALLLDPAMHRLLGLALPARALVATGFIAPLGLLMGTLFPAGLRHVAATRPALSPWAWGINACATVVGTSGCMLLVSAFGFRAALLAGSAVYFLGSLWLVRSPRVPALASGPPGPAGFV